MKLFMCNNQKASCKGKENKVYKIVLSIYGRKQAPRAWIAKLTIIFYKMGSIEAETKHPCMWRRKVNMIFLAYVFMLMIWFTLINMKMVEDFNKAMMEYEMSKLGLVRYFLRMQVSRSQCGIIFLGCNSTCHKWKAAIGWCSKSQC